MKKRIASPLLFIGLTLILISLCLTLLFGIRTKKGAEKRQQIAAKLSEMLPERTPGVAEMYPFTVMPVFEFDGVDYTAVLEIPAFGVRLPVADRWDSRKLWVCPTRFWGSAYDNSLVIGGNDAQGQFAFCDKIQNGTTVTITDMIGAEFSYTVTRIDRARHAETPWLIDEKSDLTLFCYDMYTMEYIAVRCVSAIG